MIWYLPLEPIDARYTVQWAEWYPKHLRAAGHAVEVVAPVRVPEANVNRGQFLDHVDTQIFKAEQAAMFLRIYNEGRVASNDWVLMADAWSPALTALAYVRDLERAEGRGFNIAGVLHAGVYDPWDYLHKPLAKWGPQVEQSFVRALDLIFLSCEFHRDLLEASVGPLKNAVVTGLPLYAEEWKKHSRPWETRAHRVVFPHRLAPEKMPQFWHAVKDAYTAKYGEIEWVETRALRLDKPNYYALLGSSRAVFSAALQETWGIAMLEGASLGCYPVLPRRLSYPETLPSGLFYTSVAHAVEQLWKAMTASNEFLGYRAWPWETAIAKMAAVMR